MSLGALAGILWLRPALLIAAGGLLALALARYSAAARHAGWAGVLAGALLLPPLSAILPPLRVPALAPFAAQSPAAAGPATAPPARRSDSAPATASSRPNRERDGSNQAWLGRGLLLLWLLGAVSLMARRLWAGHLARRMVTRSHPADQRIAGLFAAAWRRSGARDTVAVRVSDEVSSPLTAGVLRHTVLLPPEAEKWTLDAVDAVLVHELGHAARRDGVWNLVAASACAVYWCNPLVWLAAGRLRAESERACDDLVLISGGDAEDYAQLLLHMAAVDSRDPAPHPALAFARLRELETRLVALLDCRTRRRPLGRMGRTILGACALVLALPAAALTPLPAGAMTLRGPEPDLLADSLAAPASERLPVAARGFSLPGRARAALHGPDSILAASLAG